jgi:hypothetical protein
MDATGAAWRDELGDRRLLVSGFGKWGGGVYDLTSGRPEALDDMPTSGLVPGGGRLWRVLRAPGEQTATCELLSYDGRGVRSYQRLDAVRDPHDVCWHDGAVLLTSSWDDAVWRLTAGRPEVLWRGGTHPDGWHVNSIVVVDGALHVCAFGRFARHKAWKTSERKGTGFVHDVTTGRDVLTGLAHPHTPRRAGDRWYVCESTRGALTELDLAGTPLRRAQVKRFTRGLAVLGRWALVGGNAQRDVDDDRGDVTVVDLATMEVAERIPLPCLEVYDIVPVDPRLARGLATGFGANPARAVEQHRSAGRPDETRPAPPSAAVRLATPAVAGELAGMGLRLAPEEARRCALRGRLVARIPAGTVGTARVEVVNLSPRLLGSVPPRVVKVGARWFPVVGGERVDDAEALPNPQVPLPTVVHPGERTTMAVPLEAPDAPGSYEVRIAFRQPGVGWFGVRIQALIEVTAPLGPGD